MLLQRHQINRNVLDFDFERLCSVSLSNINIYACLVCGKYFQGRGKSSHAYAHSIHDDHHVFINLQTLKVSFAPYSMYAQRAELVIGRVASDMLALGRRNS